MATEREKMLAGELYDPLDAELVAARRRARLLAKQFNDSSDLEKDLRSSILAELLAVSQTNAWIEPPFYCDYGVNITLGDKVYFNFNCVVLDVAEVHIGDRTLFGPLVQVYTASHPLSAIPFQDFVRKATNGAYRAKPARVFDFDEIAAAHLLMESNGAGGKVVVKVQP